MNFLNEFSNRQRDYIEPTKIYNRNRYANNFESVQTSSI